MKIALVSIGKTDAIWLKEQISFYGQKLKHYYPFEYVELSDSSLLKISERTKLLDKEAELVQKFLQKGDYLVLLDECGKEFNSNDFAKYISKLIMQGSGRVVFLIGGAFGFSEQLKDKAMDTIALSKLTFTHQMVRLFMIEQLYRAGTILKNEKYHHD